MERTTALSRISSSLNAPKIQVSEATIHELPCAVGYTKEFRVSWMLTQLNTFLIVTEMEQVDVPDVRAFTDAAFEYAISNSKGWPRGFQAAIAALPCIVCDTATDAAKDLVMRTPQKHWSAFELPSIFETATNRIYTYSSTPAWGAVYFGYFRKLVKTHFSEAAKNG